MSNRADRDEDVLAHLVRQAGDPHVTPDPHYAERLRAMLLDRLASVPSTNHAAEATKQVERVSRIHQQGAGSMRHLTKIGVVATALAASIAVVGWLTLGSATNLTFAAVAEALDHLRSATYDMTSESTGQKGQPAAKATGKGFFLAPSHQRIEMMVEMPKVEMPKNLPTDAGPNADNPAVQATREAARKGAIQAIQSMPKMTMVTIADNQAGKSLMLNSNMKMAIEMDLKKLQEFQKKMAKPGQELPPDQFEMVRRLVREGSSGEGEKVEQLGKRTIDGREAIGFLSHTTQMGDMTVWADPATARPIRIELSNPMLEGVQMTMSNFHYDVDLDPTLFRLEPPADYSLQTMDLTVPTEEDLANTLRTIAEHSDGMFPAKLAMNEAVLKALMPEVDPKLEAEINAEMAAEMEKIAAKYGGEEQLRAKYGKDKELPPQILAEFQQATALLQQKRMKATMPLLQKRTQGLTFVQMLKPENDLHYVGAGVKLGTPDRPILWYKPSGAAQYHVLYADLSSKELPPEAVQQLPAAKP